MYKTSQNPHIKKILYKCQILCYKYMTVGTQNWNSIKTEIPWSWVKNNIVKMLNLYLHHLLLKKNILQWRETEKISYKRYTLYKCSMSIQKYLKVTDFSWMCAHIFGKEVKHKYKRTLCKINAYNSLIKYIISLYF